VEGSLVKITVQVVVEGGDADSPVVREVFELERGALGRDTAGLALDEAKGVLAALQETVVTEQVREAVAPTSGRWPSPTAWPRSAARRAERRRSMGALDGGSPSSPAQVGASAGCGAPALAGVAA
jgi:hypothetical protein